MTDRELLEEIFNFMVKRNYIMGDEISVRDMVTRYQQPPLTLLHMVVMQMTVEDYATLDDLLRRIVEHFNPDNLMKELIDEPAGNRPDSNISNLSPDPDVKQRKRTSGNLLSYADKTRRPL